MGNPKPVDLLLIGRTGVGKSATGNSILGSRAFRSNCGNTLVTLAVDKKESEFNGRVITVVDTPGFCWWGQETMIQAMESAIAVNPHGYNAVLLVVRCGLRFSSEDQDMIKLIKKIFGQDFLKNFCILVWTYLSDLEYAIEETGISLQQWYDELTEPLKELRNECGNRVVFFNNITREEAKKTYQTENLLQVVDSLSLKGEMMYTVANFACTRELRDKIKTSKLFQEEARAELDLIVDEIQNLMRIKDSRGGIEGLKKLQIRVDSLLESINSRNCETEDMFGLRWDVQEVKRTITNMYRG